MGNYPLILKLSLMRSFPNPFVFTPIIFSGIPTSSGSSIFIPSFRQKGMKASKDWKNGKPVSLSLLRHDMDENRAFQRFDVFQVPDKMIEPVPFQRPHIGEAQLLEECPGNEEGLQRLLQLTGELQHLPADARDRLEEVFDFRPDPVHRLTGHDKQAANR